MYKIIIKTKVTANKGSAMGAETIQNTRENLKIQKSRGNFLIVSISFFLFFTTTVFSQNFNCKKDMLDNSTVRVSPDPLRLTLGQNCEISIFNRNGNKVSNKGFSVTSNNRNVRSNGLSFYVDNNTKGDPWLYMDGKLIEVSGNITIAHNDCYETYTFPFQIRQSYVFDKTISYKGEKREFAIAPYKNSMNKNLYVVLDISRNQLYLLEAPIYIDASGLNGAQGRAGISGSAGKKGPDGSQDRYRHDGSDGSDGGDGRDGGDGGNGGDGGEIIVYMQKGQSSVIINVDGGAGGRGGAAGPGGKGGTGGKGYAVKIDTGKKGVLGGTIYREEKLGKDGRDGRDGAAGLPGRDGQPGRKGYYEIRTDNNIKKYFEDIRHLHFDIEMIDE